MVNWRKPDIYVVFHTLREEQIKFLENLKEAGFTFSLVKSGKFPWKGEYLSMILKVS